MSYREHPVTDYRRVVGSDGQLIDVREPSELADGMLPGARNIPLGSLPHRVHELDPKRPVVLVCRSGNRSGQAGRWLADRGFRDVVNLSGGMLAAGSLRAGV
jgi:rhodanese-related sulfurtransferase